jgi:hypothetical protein
MKTKEQILEKIMRRDARVEKTYTDPHDLASYLATIEERLEKIEGGRPVKNPYYFGLADKARLKADKAFNPDGSPKDPTPTDEEKLQKWGLARNNGNASMPTPTEVKDWEEGLQEVLFQYGVAAHKNDEETYLYSFTGVLDMNKIKSFIRKLLGNNG